MNFIKKFRYRAFSQGKYTNNLLKEMFRKFIHILSVLVIPLAKYFYTETVCVLFFAVILYVLSEHLRLMGKKIPIISAVTKFAARERDGGKFVFGPVTLSAGIIFTLILFPHQAAALGIFALSLGDGVASLAGKIFGKRHLPFSRDKTVAGTFSCFFAVFTASFLFTKHIGISFTVALCAAVSEAFPLKDLDNILIPIVCASAAFTVYRCGNT